jgi:hypothetical protein
MELHRQRGAHRRVPADASRPRVGGEARSDGRDDPGATTVPHSSLYHTHCPVPCGSSVPLSRAPGGPTSVPIFEQSNTR